MKVKAAVIAAAAVQQAMASSATKNVVQQAATQGAQTAANPFNFFGQPTATAAQPAMDPVSQMMAHGHAALFGQPPPAGQAAAAANPLPDPFQMANDAAAQAHQHMTNMHQAAQDMMNQGHQAVAQMTQQGHQAAADAHAAFSNMMTTTPVPAQTTPISRSCDVKIECFSEINLPFSGCSGVQGGATCIGGKMFPWPSSGVCSCNKPDQVCSPKPAPSGFSTAQCTSPDAAYTGTKKSAALAGPVVLTTASPLAANSTMTLPAAAAVVPTAVPVAGVSAASCTGKCGRDFSPSESCQCNKDCSKYNSCCTDYHQLCVVASAPGVAPVVIDGTTPLNVAGTTPDPSAFSWIPGFAPAHTGRLYDADVKQVEFDEEPAAGPSGKLMMAWTVCCFTYAVLGFAVIRGVGFARRHLSDERRVGFINLDGLDEELALEGEAIE